MKSRLKQYKSLPLLAGLFALLAFGCVSGERGGNGEPDLPDMVEVDLSVGISNISQSLQTKADAPAALEVRSFRNHRRSEANLCVCQLGIAERRTLKRYRCNNGRGFYANVTPYCFLGIRRQ